MELPPAVVLAFTGTGLATVRCLSAGGVAVTAAIFPSSGTGQETGWSRRCKTVSLDFSDKDEEALLQWLIRIAGGSGSRPVVFATSDRTALFLAVNRDRLSAHCRVWTTSAADMQRIVSKDGLYRAAVEAGVPVPPMLIEPGLAEVVDWCASNRPPYIAKPFYSAVGDSSITGKNRVFDSIDGLVGFVRDSGTRNVIVQRMIESGDGNLCDVYGLCNRDGKVITLASHGRIRQYPANTGATSYGEIPFEDPDVERRCFELTRKLLARFRYHGIFGIEWLREAGTGNLFLTDFNARPFSSIGHLCDSGLNLPLLSYRELVGGVDPEIEETPALRHSYWMDFNCDLRSFRDTHRGRGRTWGEFARDLSRCRSFAFFDVRDPGPALARGLDLMNILATSLRKAWKQ
jgi:predicted ATP-grasp superfamily ATP-dependent carboligase